MRGQDVTRINLSGASHLPHRVDGNSVYFSTGSHPANGVAHEIVAHLEGDELVLMPKRASAHRHLMRLLGMAVAEPTQS